MGLKYVIFSDRSLGTRVMKLRIHPSAYHPCLIELLKILQQILLQNLPIGLKETQRAVRPGGFITLKLKNCPPNLLLLERSLKPKGFALTNLGLVKPLHKRSAPIRASHRKKKSHPLSCPHPELRVPPHPPIL